MSASQDAVDRLAAALDDPRGCPIDAEVGRLRELADTLSRAGCDAHPAFRADLRRRLVAAAAAPDIQVRSMPARWRRWPAYAAAALLLVVVLLGVTSVGARHAVPGEALYRVKLAQESAQLAAVRDPLARGKLHFAFAHARLREVQELLDLPPAVALGGPVLAAGSASDPRTIQLVVQALNAASDESQAGARDLTLAFDQTQNPSALTLLRRLAGAQQERLRALMSALPTAARRDASQGLRMLGRVDDQAAEALEVCGGCKAPATAASPASVVPPTSPSTPPAVRPSPPAAPTGGDRSDSTGGGSPAGGSTADAPEHSTGTPSAPTSDAPPTSEPPTTEPSSEPPSTEPPSSEPPSTAPPSSGSDPDASATPEISASSSATPEQAPESTPPSPSESPQPTGSPAPDASSTGR